MNINNSPRTNTDLKLYATKVTGDTVTLTPLKGKEQTAALRAFSENKPVKNFAYQNKNGELVVTKDLYSPERTYVIKNESGKQTSLSGRVRVMDAADVAEIKAFANQYFANMEKNEAKKGEEVFKDHNWQEAPKSDKKEGQVAMRAIARANEREVEAQQGKENRAVENKSNKATGEKIRRYYDHRKVESEELAKFKKQTLDNKIN